MHIVFKIKTIRGGIIIKKFYVKWFDRCGDIYEEECFENTLDDVIKNLRRKEPCFSNFIELYEMQQIFWFSRYHMPDRMKDDLYKKFGICDIYRVNDDIDSAYDFKTVIENADVIALDDVTPELQNQFLDIAGNKKVIVPCYRDQNDFLKWKRLIKVVVDIDL